MQLLRKNNIWLKHLAEKEVKLRHRNLYDSYRLNIKNKLFVFFSSKGSWKVIIISVLLFFYLSTVINIYFLNFVDIDKKTINSLVDQRTTNIASIMSISLVVVGFLMTNLAVKKPKAFSLLFERSLFYLTIYLTLSTISCFILLSTFRNSFSEFYFIRMVLAGTYLALFIIVLIGRLFQKIILFSDENEVNKLIDNKLIKEAKKDLKFNLVKLASNDIFKQKMKLLNINHAYNTTLISIARFNYLLNYDRQTSEFDINNKKKKYLINVNLVLLKGLVHLNKKKIESYSELTLFEKNNIELYSIFKLSEKQTFAWVYSKLLSYLIFKTSKKEVTNTNTYLDEEKKKVLDAVRYDNEKDLNSSLTTLLELYKLQIEAEKEYGRK